MKLEMHRNSLFAVLLRSPWWMSALVAAGIFGAVRFFLAVEYAAFAASPFIVITLYVAWKQLRAPSAGRIARTLERISAMSREEFTAALEAGWREQGYEVVRAKGAQADLELRRAGRLSLVGCRRWKAASTGVEPLRELHAAGRAREAQELVYVAAGEITAQARTFAQANAIRLVHGAELAGLVRLKRG
jgi:restriction system protein